MKGTLLDHQRRGQDTAPILVLIFFFLFFTFLFLRLLKEKDLGWTSALTLPITLLFFTYYLIYSSNGAEILFLFTLRWLCRSMCLIVLNPAEQQSAITVEKCLCSWQDRIALDLVRKFSCRNCFLLDLRWPTDPKVRKVKKWSKKRLYYRKFVTTMVNYWSHVLPERHTHINLFFPHRLIPSLYLGGTIGSGPEPLGTEGLKNNRHLFLKYPKQYIND